MQSLLQLARLIDTMNDRIGRAVSWLAALMVLVGAFNAIARYLSRALGKDLSSNAYLEGQWYLFSIILLLGMAYTLRHDRHVRVDLFYADFSPRDQALVNLFGGILFLLPWSILVIYASYDYALISYKIGETSPDPGGLPARYVIKFGITLGAFLLMLQGIASLIDSALVLSGRQQPKLPETEDTLKENL